MNAWSNIVGALFVVAVLACSSANVAEIFQWRDEHGRIHYSDNPHDAKNAQPTTLAPTTIIEPPPLPSSGQEVTPAESTPATPIPTAADWAAEHCSERVRVLYTERSFIPCVPTDEVSVYLCKSQPPRKFRRYFGREYHYRDRESECGPEIYEGETLYIKK